MFFPLSMLNKIFKIAVKLSVIILIFFSFLTIRELLGYTAQHSGVRVAEINIQQLGKQYFQLTLSPAELESKNFIVHGDMWQLDARIFVWSDFLVSLGIEPIYKFDRLSGRYQTIDDEKTKERSVYSLSNASNFMDLWSLMKRMPWFPGIKAHYGSGTFVPLVDGAQFSVYLRQDGLIAKPENDPANNAIKNWINLFN